MKSTFYQINIRDFVDKKSQYRNNTKHIIRKSIRNNSIRNCNPYLETRSFSRFDLCIHNSVDIIEVLMILSFDDCRSIIKIGFFFLFFIFFFNSRRRGHFNINIGVF
uniref:Candidate secreted effector n=1 Tax=Meloidogyne incognita TaxID=6306 RepID=A0A914MKR2_MELIC